MKYKLCVLLLRFRFAIERVQRCLLGSDLNEHKLSTGYVFLVNNRAVRNNPV